MKKQIFFILLVVGLVWLSTYHHREPVGTCGLIEEITDTGTNRSWVTQSIHIGDRVFGWHYGGGFVTARGNIRYTPLITNCRERE